MSMHSSTTATVYQGIMEFGQEHPMIASLGASLTFLVGIAVFSVIIRSLSLSTSIHTPQPLVARDDPEEGRSLPGTPITARIARHQLSISIPITTTDFSHIDPRALHRMLHYEQSPVLALQDTLLDSRIPHPSPTQPYSEHVAKEAS